MASSRAADFKRRTLRYTDLQNARSQRLQQQAVSRQDQRENHLLNRRNGLQPIYNREAEAAKENIAALTANQKKKNLMEKLKNYREQKKAAEAKRKEELKKRPPFVVPGIAYQKPDFFSLLSKETKHKHPVKPASITARVFTRSQAKAAAAAGGPPTTKLETRKNVKKTPHPAAGQLSRRIPLAALNIRESFAPQNFQFQAPAGVQAIDVLQEQQPLAVELATLSLRSPIHVRNSGHRDVVLENVSSRDAEDNEQADTGSNFSSAGSETKELKPDGSDHTGDQNMKPAVSSEKTEQAKDERDIFYFRNLIITERENFNKKCSKWEDILESSTIPEENEGSIRTAIGQAKLLDKERFAQFSKLIDQCEHKTGEKEITFTDLDGFWDMIYFQVEDVHKKFAELEKLRSNDWKEEVTAPQRKTRAKKQPAAAVSKRNAPKSNIRAFIAEAKAKAAQQSSVSSPKTPAANRLENLRKSTIKKEARKSLFIVDDLSDAPEGVTSALESAANTLSEEILVSPVPHGSIKCEGGVRRSARIQAMTSPIEERHGESNRRITRSVARALAATPIREDARSSSKNRSGRLTPVSQSVQDPGTPAARVNHHARRRLHELD